MRFGYIIRSCLVRVFKQQFLIFLKIYIGKKIYKNTYNII